MPTPLLAEPQGDLFLTPAAVTPAFYRAHRDRIAAFDGITAIRLHRGEADVAAFTAAVGELSGGGPGVQVLPASGEAAKAGDAMDVLALGLAATAAAAGLAGLVAVGLAGPMGVVPTPVVPALAVLIAVPATVLAANLLAAPLRLAAARIPPVTVLRSE